MTRVLVLVQIVTVAALVAVTLYTWDTRLVMLEHDGMIVAARDRLARLEQDLIRAQRAAPPMVTAPAPARPPVDEQAAKSWAAGRMLDLERRVVEMEAAR